LRIAHTSRPLPPLNALRAFEAIARHVADHALDAAVAGAGVSLSYKLIASDDVRSRRLVIPFGPELPLTERAYHFVCPRGHETRPNVRAFRDWLFAEMAETRAQWATVRSRWGEGQSSGARTEVSSRPGAEAAPSGLSRPKGGCNRQSATPSPA
jgi:LysR substrate binding domain